jgi:Flp pilus assembly pilin Flp
MFSSRVRAARALLVRLYRMDDGMLTFEWTVLSTVLVLGIVGGLTTVRDALNQELAQVAQAITSMPQLNGNSPSSTPALSNGSTGGSTTSAMNAATSGLVPLAGAVQNLQGQAGLHRRGHR